MTNEFDFVIQQFLDKIKYGPDFVCCVCHRLLLKHQVLVCKKDYYNKSKSCADIAAKCITEDYVHKCCKDCATPCKFIDTSRGKLIICYSCHYKFSKGCNVT